ncbi:MAG TPA: chitobiase/beta-hexosaminidase C-terminal domain-containing protein, partial [Planctomycetota bacterium]|nr:chitobiase/beta-hexosaminidase C-terminal domain-containing protein [Planctomycetota bacterium]
MARTSLQAVALFLVVTSLSAHAVDSVSVNATSVLADVSRKPVGINMNYLMDSERRRTSTPPRTTQAALQEMNVRFLRYPGGEKSDSHMAHSFTGLGTPWSSSSPTLCRTGPNEWPAGDRQFTNADNATWISGKEPMSFDEFMTICKNINAEPVIVLPYDSMYKALTSGGTRPTRMDLINHAREWVRYANVTKGYGVKYWTIGNETDYTSDGNPGATQYAQDVIDFSTAMKGVDATIKIGVNGRSSAWFQTLLNTASTYFDYLDVHDYPPYNWTSGYNTFKNGTPSFTSSADTAISAISASTISTSEKSRIKVTVSELGAHDWANAWANQNDIGHALVLFDIVGQHLKKTQVDYVQFWNTRWIDNDAFALPVGTTNLITTNPGFESDLSGWTENFDATAGNSSITTVAGEFRSGAKGLKVTGSTDGGRGQVATSLFTPNTVYTFKVWARETSTSVWAGGGVTFYSGGNSVGGASFTCDSTSWKEYTASFKAPPAFDFVDIWCYKSGGAATLYIDDFSIVTGAAPGDLNALDSRNQLLATGRALAIWGNFLQQNLVTTTSTAMVRTYASHTPSTNKLTVFLTNKDTIAHDTALTLTNYPNATTARRWVFKGTTPEDLQPTWNQLANVAVSSNVINTTLDPLSITVLELQVDATAPAAITSLSATASTSSSVTLSWTAPGDDGSSGTAASYDIRYSTSTITDANWASATQASGEPTPAAAGTTQTFTVGGLNAGATYYFAIKTSDEVPNTSGLSNVVSRATTSARDYYVSATGADTNPGTQAQPWKTIGKVNNTSFAAGDRIFFEGGQTFAGNLSFGSDDAGTAASPITVSSYGTGRATLNAGTGKGISLYNTAGFSISNLIVVGGWNSSTQSGNTGSGVELYMDLNGAVKLNYIRIDNLDVSGFKSVGIVFGSWPADGSKSGYNDVQITNCVAHDNGDCGISSWGYFTSSATTYAHSNVIVRNCTTYNNRGIVNKGTNSGSGIVLSDLDGGLIERCVAYNNGELCNYSGGGPVGIWLWDARGITMQFNESYDNKTGSSSTDGGGFDLDGGVTNCIVQYNYSHNNHGSGYLVYQFGGARPALSGNIIRYNISQNDGRAHGHAGIYMGGGSAVANNHIYNNTIYIAPTTSGAAIKITGVGSGNKIRNNILQTSGAVKLIDANTNYATSSVQFQGNAYYAGTTASNFIIKWGATNYTDLASWRATGQEKNGTVDTGLQGDPLLTSAGNGGTIGNPDQLSTLSAYKLLSGSPLIDAGLNLQSLFSINPGTRDFYGNTIPAGAGYDIGAHDTSVSTGVATPTFTPNGGTFDNAVSVTIACATTGATIHYTTDGSTPTTASPVYSAALSLSATTTLKALAVKSGMADSTVASATFTKNAALAAPTFTPNGG